LSSLREIDTGLGYVYSIPCSSPVCFHFPPSQSQSPVFAAKIVGNSWSTSSSPRESFVARLRPHLELDQSESSFFAGS
jgi:hypothetical protein